VSPIGPIAAATAPAAPQGPAPAPPKGQGPSLLADPVPGALAGADPLSMIYLFEAKDQQLGVAASQKKIAGLEDERHALLAQEEQAIQHAIDAQKNRSFWDDLGSVFGEVAKVAAVVASVAAAVVTVGAATPIAALAIAGAVLSTASFADGELHVLHTLGVDDKTAGWIDMGMALGGSAMSFGAAIAAGGQVASSAVSTFGKAAGVVGGAGAIGTAAAKIAEGQALADGDQAAADEVLAAARSDHATRLMQLIIGDAQTSDEQSQKIMRAIVTSKTIQDDTTLAAAAGVRG
jgi:hypothetical protein